MNMNVSMKQKFRLQNGHGYSFPAAIKIIACVLCIAGPGLLQSVAQTNTPTRLDYAAFKVIADKNIFNPNRYARGSQNSRNTPRSTTPASRVESFTLVGLMEYEKGMFAFFDGTSSNYRKTLELNGEIAGHKLASATTQSVILTDGTNHFELRVGSQMRREDDSEWFVNDEGDSGTRRRMARGSSRGRIYGDSSTGNGPEGTAAATGDAEPEVILIEPDANSTISEGENTTTTAPAENGNGNGGNGSSGSDEITDPVLRRLMERRQQEINR